MLSVYGVIFHLFQEILTKKKQMAEAEVAEAETETSHSAPATSIFIARNYCCRKVMFSQACVKNYIHRGVCIPAVLWGQTPPPSTTGYDQQAGGMHPTGMHSCLICHHIFLLYR